MDNNANSIKEHANGLLKAVCISSSAFSEKVILLLRKLLWFAGLLMIGFDMWLIGRMLYHNPGTIIEILEMPIVNWTTGSLLYIAIAFIRYRYLISFIFSYPFKAHTMPNDEKSAGESVRKEKEAKTVPIEQLIAPTKSMEQEAVVDRREEGNSRENDFDETVEANLKSDLLPNNPSPSEIIIESPESQNLISGEDSILNNEREGETVVDKPENPFSAFNVFQNPKDN
ncbi:MAG: hypothetical protein MI866_17810 [Bacteroidales bacterium]|nr:hypothetical protein [Bacteroidales bacterium]